MVECAEDGWLDRQGKKGDEADDRFDSEKAHVVLIICDRRRRPSSSLLVLLLLVSSIIAAYECLLEQRVFDRVLRPPYNLH